MSFSVHSRLALIPSLIGSTIHILPAHALPQLSPQPHRILFSQAIFYTTPISRTPSYQPSRPFLPPADRWLPIRSPIQQLHARPLTLWATYYYVYQARPTANGLPLLDPAGTPLSPPLSVRDWCYAALQGTVQVTDVQERTTTYNFAGRGDIPQTDCSPFFSSLSATVADKVSRVRFTPIASKYGRGAKGVELVPYRTIAVDPTLIPFGSVVYIPQANGQVITLPSGQQVIHDGYFYAADTGSAIVGNHIDVFLGTNPQNPFPFVTSKPNGEFAAYVVEDTAITQALQGLHQPIPR
ncbi:3D domain-containing protein [Pantanalinema rosaneae CENA516]|uniref:3D domain-containing protein n=1 Tax=Pantanalinema rosaneae TaxID=1620701 RepID=UPI003D6DD9F0